MLGWISLPYDLRCTNSASEISAYLVFFSVQAKSSSCIFNNYFGYIPGSIINNTT